MALAKIPGAQAFAGTVSALVINHLFLPGHDPVIQPYTIAANQSLPYGSVLGFITATEELALSLPTATDGSQIPTAVMVEDLDTYSSGPQIMGVLVEGFVNELALVFGAGHTPDTARIPLRDRGIFMDVPRYSFA